MRYATNKTEGMFTHFAELQTSSLKRWYRAAWVVTLSNTLLAASALYRWPRSAPGKRHVDCVAPLHAIRRGLNIDQGLDWPVPA